MAGTTLGTFCGPQHNQPLEVFYWKRPNLPEFVRIRLYQEGPNPFIRNGQAGEHKFYLWTGSKRGGILQTGFNTACTRMCRGGLVLHLYADYPPSKLYRGQLAFLPKARQLIHCSHEVHLKSQHTL